MMIIYSIEHLFRLIKYTTNLNFSKVVKCSLVEGSLTKLDD